LIYKDKPDVVVYPPQDGQEEDVHDGNEESSGEVHSSHAEEETDEEVH